MAIIHFGKQPNPMPLCLFPYKRPALSWQTRQSYFILQCIENTPWWLSEPPLVLITRSIIMSKPTCLQSYRRPVNISRLHYAISDFPSYPIHSIESNYCEDFIHYMNYPSQTEPPHGPCANRPWTSGLIKGNLECKSMNASPRLW